MKVQCAWCTPKEEHNNNASHGICDPCLERFFPKQNVQIKTCGNCLDKNLKCQIIACPELSQRLDKIDEELKLKGE